MKVAVENETIKVNSPYNKSFVAGGKADTGQVERPLLGLPRGEQGSCQGVTHRMLW